jgi:SagB-type dehydrogenase family enzyme
MSDLLRTDRNWPALEDSLWELFHENSKIGRWDSLLNGAGTYRAVSSAAERPDFRAYPAVRLPEADLSELRVSLTPAPAGSTPTGKPAAVQLPQLATLLGGGCRLAAMADCERWDFTGPAAAALALPQPFRLFVHCVHVEGLEAGLYYYDTTAHLLRLINPGGHASAIAAAMLSPTIAVESEVMFFLSTRLTSADLPHGNRDYRLLLVEVGRLAHSFQLVANHLELSCVQVGSFFDRQMDAWLALDGVTQSVLLVLGIGQLPGRQRRGP